MGKGNEGSGGSGREVVSLVPCYWCACLTANLGKVCVRCLDEGDPPGRSNDSGPTTREEVVSAEDTERRR